MSGFRLLAAVLAAAALGACETLEDAVEEAAKSLESGAGAPAAPGGGAVAPGNAKHCFGAVGNDCGQPNDVGVAWAACSPTPGGTPPAGNGACWVNSGSWLHDECCELRPDGVACAAPSTNACQTEWDIALHRTAAGYSWTRDVNYGVANATGRIDAGAYCGPPGAKISTLDDPAFCCSGSARPGTFAERLAQPQLMVCE